MNALFMFDPYYARPAVGFYCGPTDSFTATVSFPYSLASSLFLYLFRHICDVSALVNPGAAVRIPFLIASSPFSYYDQD